LQDDFPLASLPLLGYAVDTPSTEDNIQKDFVFKLQFKNHVYFFRAESQFTYERSVNRGPSNLDSRDNSRSNVS
jgi:FERM/RhoGEF/pleckstrin domain protein 2